MTTPIKHYVKTVTPAWAAHILGTLNTHNRPFRRDKIEEYKLSLIEGQWKLSGEPIKFRNDGTLDDGQNRLQACVETGIPFETLVVEGLGADVFPVLDSGARRSAADVLTIAGYPEGGTMAAIAHLCIAYENGHEFFNNSVPKQTLVKWMKDHPDLRSWMTQTSFTGGTRKFIAPVVATAYLGSYRYVRKAEDFIYRFVTGTDLKRGDPILTLRERLMSDSMFNRGLKKHDRFALVIAAWNAHVQDRTLSKLQAPRGFPTIVGARAR